MPRVVSLFLPARSTDRLRRTLGGAAPLAEAPARPDRPQGEAAGGALLARSLPASRHMNNLLVALGPEKAFTQSGRIFEREPRPTSRRTCHLRKSNLARDRILVFGQFFRICRISRRR